MSPVAGDCQLQLQLLLAEEGRQHPEYAEICAAKCASLVLHILFCFPATLVSNRGLDRQKRKAAGVQPAQSCCRSRDTTNAASQPPSAEQSSLPHPLAEAQATHEPAQHHQSSPLQHQPDTQGSVSSQSAAQAEQDSGPSDELLDLFASIEVLRQELDALPDPGSLTPTTSQDREVDTEHQVSRKLFISG